MKIFQEIETELTRLRLLEPQLLKRITVLEAENKKLRTHASTGYLERATPAEATDSLWDALRLEACSTGLDAKRIVMLNKDDLAKALKRLMAPNAQEQTTARTAPAQKPEA